MEGVRLAQLGSRLQSITKSQSTPHWTNRLSNRAKSRFILAHLARLNAAGIRIALGTDGNIPWAAHEEMADMVASKMTPAQVIVAATRNSAMLVGLKDVGTVEKGKSADFLVLDANPLDDITNTRRINAVYLHGTPVDRAGLRTRWTGKGSK
ncbi:MAG: hypothetical protein DMG30_18355 [Acidobacteria bacterium]|nr:MAG: hypothetical protein DMG30_18355 [Acidobacteriota bacterium]